MSLITRCPTCNAAFKVVEDQIKVSGGWVRCGQCSEVFDATRHIHVPSVVLAPAAPAQAQPKLASEPDSALMPTMPAPLPSAAQESADHAPQSSASAAPQAERARLTVESATVVKGEPKAPTRARRGASRSRARSKDSTGDGLGNAPANGVKPADGEPVLEPTFVRQAKAQMFWRRPWVRGVMGASCTVLLVALLAQWVAFNSSLMAAKQPAAKAWLVPLCDWLGCSVKPLAAIEAVAIDSSALGKERSDIYKLSLVIKNTSTMQLETPAVELALTDTQDQVVLRRVLRPADLGMNTTLPASGELSGTARMQVDGALFSGYRVLAFYP